MHDEAAQLAGVYLFSTRKQMTLDRLQPRHDDIDKRCIEWAKWVRVHHRPFGVQPMFKNYMSKARQWEVAPEVPVALNLLAAQEIEQLVSKLEDKERRVIRWVYVWPALHINAVAREFGVTHKGLVLIRDRALDRLVRALQNEYEGVTQ